MPADPPKLRPLVIAATILAAASTALWTGTAFAGTYTVHTCAGLEGKTGGWREVTRGGPRTQIHDCNDGSGMFAALSGNQQIADSGMAGWAFEAPSGTMIRGLSMRRRRTVANGYAYGVFLYETKGGQYYGTAEECRPPSACVDKAASPFSWSTTRNTKDIQVRVQCGASSGQTCPSVSDPAASVLIEEAKLTLADNSPPNVTSPADGTLLSGQQVSGVQTFSVGVSDQGGGVAGVTLEIALATGQTMSKDYPLCSEPYRTKIPCPSSVSFAREFDTSGLPDGIHSARLLVRDASGATISEPPSGFITLATNQAAGFALDELLGMEQLGYETFEPPRGLLSARLRPHRSKRRSRVRLTVPFRSRRAVISGRLRTLDGDPIGGERLLVSARPVNGEWSQLAAVKTSRRGRYSLRLPAGPSREVRVSYGATVSDALLRVRAGVRLVIPRRIQRGKTTRLSGRILGGIRLAHRKLVELQALRGGKWVTFATTRAATNGRFNLEYRFAPGPLTWHQLRVLVPRESGFLYSAGASRPARVLVG